MDTDNRPLESVTDSAGWDVELTDDEKLDAEPSDAEKLDYIYQLALKLGALVDSVTPQQIEKVSANPMMGMLMKSLGFGR